MKPLVICIIPVHNRRETTMACLARLRELGTPAWLQVMLVDDGSTDGTAAAVQAAFPSCRILPSEGSLWWTGAIELGMRTAMAQGADFVFWLNDDCQPMPGAMEILLHVARERRAVVGAVAVMPRTGRPRYGGFRKSQRGLDFCTANPGEIVECDALNGNLVCLPRSAIEAVGLPDGQTLPHAHGDTDYTLRLRAADVPVLLVGDARCLARPNVLANERSWLLGDITSAEMWRGLAQRHSYAYFPAELRFRSRHWGIRGILHVIGQVAKRALVTLLRLALPQTILRRWWGHRSVTWRREQELMAELADRHD